MSEKAIVTNLAKLPLHLGDELGGRELAHNASAELDAELVKTHPGLNKLAKKVPPAVSIVFQNEDKKETKKEGNGTVTQPTADEIIKTESGEQAAPVAPVVPEVPPAPVEPVKTEEPKTETPAVLEPETEKKEDLKPETEQTAPTENAPVEVQTPAVDAPVEQAAPTEEVKVEETVTAPGAPHKDSSKKKNNNR